MRQVVLDTETTGLDPAAGHKIIEIGCVELVGRRLTGKHYHQYIQPGREVEAEAIAVHGITNEFLTDKPLFHTVVDDFLQFIGDAELIIHNAPFDIGFLNHELRLIDPLLTAVDQRCAILDTLVLARKKHPGQKNNLDALCKRYTIDNSKRDLHGALLDAEILADVYLAMTGGQRNLALSSDALDEDQDGSGDAIRRVASQRPALKVVHAGAQELERHQQKLHTIDQASGGHCLWLQYPPQ